MKPNALLTFATLLTVAVSAAADQRQDANSDGYLAAIARLVANAGAVHVLNERGNTPLRMAPEAGHAAVIYNDAFSSLRVTSALVRDHIAVIRTFRNVGAHGAIQAPETTGRHRIAKESDNARDANTTIAGQVANKANELVAAVEANVRLLQAAQDGRSWRLSRCWRSERIRTRRTRMDTPPCTGRRTRQRCGARGTGRGRRRYPRTGQPRLHDEDQR